MNNALSSVSASGAGQPQEGLAWPFPESMPGRLLGIDAGGSGTRAVLVADGQVAGRFTAPPMNALLTGDLTDRLAALIGGVDAADAAGVGVPGLRSRDAAAALGAELTRRAGNPVQVATDGETAWLGAFGGSPGIAVFAGTGSGAVGCDGRRWARAGGHGFLLGDEGSAYWIGRAAANAALRWDDRMGGSLALFDAAIEVSDGDLRRLCGASTHTRPNAAGWPRSPRWADAGGHRRVRARDRTFGGGAPR